jgi:hypothetical protein
MFDTFSRMRQFKKMSQMLGKLYTEAFESGMERDIEKEFQRASGLCVCDHCGLEYQLHPAIGSDMLLVVTCDGRFWKL